MLNKKFIFALILFVSASLYVFTFANQTSDIDPNSAMVTCNETTNGTYLKTNQTILYHKNNILTNLDSKIIIDVKDATLTQYNYLIYKEILSDYMFLDHYDTTIKIEAETKIVITTKINFNEVDIAKLIEITNNLNTIYSNQEKLDLNANTSYIVNGVAKYDSYITNIIPNAICQ